MRRTGAVGLAIAASLLLAACFLLPGKFVSTLDVRRDGAFTFAYQGEIVLVNSTELQPKVTEAAPMCFGPVPGTQESTAGTKPSIGPRPCNADEAIKRKADTDANRRREGAALAQLTGVDPSDPASMRAFAADLAKQAGWRSVVYRGDGVFDVDYRLSGHFDRDFIFPVVPRATFIVPFVAVRKRADGAVLVSAPGFTANPAEALARGVQAGMATTPARPASGGPQGSFVVTSDLPPLTNNTEDGPSRDGDRSRLAWTVSAALHKVPEALLPLDR